jgi:hypothetical protein
VAGLLLGGLGELQEQGAFAQVGLGTGDLAV